MLYTGLVRLLVCGPSAISYFSRFFVGLQRVLCMVLIFDVMIPLSRSKKTPQVFFLIVLLMTFALQC